MLLIAWCVPWLALAHASGISFEHVVGTKRVDIGYDPVSLVEGETQVFDFALINVADEELISFDELWVRVVLHDRTILATGLRESPFGRTTLLYVFPDSGDYEMRVSFREGGETLAEATFPFSVTPQERSWTTSAYTYVAVGSLIGICVMSCIGWYLRKRL